MTQPDAVRDAIAAECDAVKRLLLEKNDAYGNSALDPIRIFSKADPLEQIRVRLDDKLSRIARGEAAGEDVELDLIGYLVLMRVARSLGLEPDTEPRIVEPGETEFRGGKQLDTATRSADEFKGRCCYER